MRTSVSNRIASPVQRTHRVVAMPGTQWKPSETKYVQRNYGKKSAQQIADHLRRSVRSVYQHATKCGAAGTYDKSQIARRDKKIKQLHAKGWSASEMESLVGIGRRTINARINQMGLTPNGRNERYRKRVAQKTREQCMAAGVASLGELRAKEMKRVAHRLGWPDHLALRSVQILETLYQQGPMTRKQIAKAIGMRWVGSRKTFSTKRVPGHSYLAELQRAGLVVRLESAITHKGKGNHQDLYMVALEVEPCQEARTRYQSQKSKRT